MWVSAEHETFVYEMLNLGRIAVADNGKAYVLEVEYIAI